MEPWSKTPQGELCDLLYCAIHGEPEEACGTRGQTRKRLTDMERRLWLRVAECDAKRHMEP